MRVRLAILLMVPALLQSCALHEHRAYSIARPTPRDVAKVRQILHNIAIEARLPDTSRETYDVRESLASYRTDNVWLMANIFPDRIEVYLSRSDWPPPQAFTKADGLLAPALSATFGHRFGVQKEGERVIVY
jgi:hypothetical protein